MVNIDELKKIAVLIDAENAQYSKIRAILDEISAHGHIIVKRAYGDWSKDVLKNWKDVLNTLAIQPEQQFSYTTGKNSSDAKMIIDAMDLLYTNKFDAFVLVTSDSDFTSLANRLKQSEIFVFGVGENKTPISFRNACDDFILTENLEKLSLTSSNQKETSNQQPDTTTTDKSSAEKPKATKGRKKSTANKTTTTEKSTTAVTQEDNSDNNASVNPVIELLLKAWELYHDETGYVNVSGAGQYLKRLKPDFDVRTYGFTKLPELIESISDKFETTKYKGKGTAYIFAYKPRKK